ncbi:MAG: hypothetical protein IJG50_03400 [Clostridia bacterium]|nr:hypothetical protein [Clostridia bacterium]
MKSKLHKLLVLILALVMAAGLLPMQAMAATVIAWVNVTLDTPVVGALPDYTAEFSDGGHCCTVSGTESDPAFLNSVSWFDETANKALIPGKGDVFEAGHSYTVTVCLTAEEGYRFYGSTHPILNGINLDPGVLTPSGIYKIEYTFTSVKDPLIDSVSVTVDAPRGGERPDYTAEFPAGALYRSDTYSTSIYKNDIMWSDVTDGTTYLNIDSGVFQADRRYRVTVYLTAQEGCHFSGSTKATVNGMSPDSVSVTGSGQLMVTCTFPVIKEIARVSITMDKPELGAKPDYAPVFSGDTHYRTVDNVYGGKNGIQWIDRTMSSEFVDPDSGTFQKAHIYEVDIWLMPDDGYAFSNQLTISLNGETIDLAKIVQFEGGSIKVDKIYSREDTFEKITDAEITIDAPAAGRKPDYVEELPVGALYYADIYWYDVTAGSHLSSRENERFQEGHQYRVTVDLLAEEASEFSESTTVTLNGISPDSVRFVDMGKLEVIYTFPALMSLDGSVSGNKITYTVSGAPSGAVLIAARYNGGKMTWSETVSSPKTTDTLTAGGSGADYKLFLIDGAEYRPLCDAWSS